MVLLLGAVCYAEIELWLAACTSQPIEVTGMAISKKELIRELKHQINSPLAAIRNAIYLTAVRVKDPEVARYLTLANDQVSRIAMVLHEADQLNENKRLQLCLKPVDASPSSA
jgi:nitrogen-specific signal transduction histidine kinase